MTPDNDRNAVYVLKSDSRGFHTDGEGIIGQENWWEGSKELASMRFIREDPLYGGGDSLVCFEHWTDNSVNEKMVERTLLRNVEGTGLDTVRGELHDVAIEYLRGRAKRFSSEHFPISVRDDSKDKC